MAASLVDGGYQTFDVEADFLERLERLEAEGMSGKDLIHALLTDDWGAPPVFIEIKGVTPDGKRIDRRIAYD